jgi:hypothetical protein
MGQTSDPLRFEVKSDSQRVKNNPYTHLSL